MLEKLNFSPLKISQALVCKSSYPKIWHSKFVDFSLEMKLTVFRKYANSRLLPQLKLNEIFALEEHRLKVKHK
jgi:hypothetical protein